jgi:hypothetical protein
MTRVADLFEPVISPMYLDHFCLPRIEPCMPLTDRYFATLPSNVSAPKPMVINRRATGWLLLDDEVLFESMVDIDPEVRVLPSAFAISSLAFSLAGAPHTLQLDEVERLYRKGGWTLIPSLDIDIDAEEGAGVAYMVRQTLVLHPLGEPTNPLGVATAELRLAPGGEDVLVTSIRFTGMAILTNSNPKLVAWLLADMLGRDLGRIHQSLPYRPREGQTILVAAPIQPTPIMDHASAEYAATALRRFARSFLFNSLSGIDIVRAEEEFGHLEEDERSTKDRSNLVGMQVERVTNPEEYRRVLSTLDDDDKEAINLLTASGLAPGLSHLSRGALTSAQDSTAALLQLIDEVSSYTVVSDRSHWVGREGLLSVHSVNVTVPGHGSPFSFDLARYRPALETGAFDTFQSTDMPSCQTAEFIAPSSTSRDVVLYRRPDMLGYAPGVDEFIVARVTATPDSAARLLHHLAVAVRHAATLVEGNTALVLEIDSGKWSGFPGARMGQFGLVWSSDTNYDLLTWIVGELPFRSVAFNSYALPSDLWRAVTEHVQPAMA